MTLPGPLSEHAQAVHDVLLATSRYDEDGRLVSTEPLYRFLLDRFGIEDPASRLVRTRVVRELTERGLVRRTTVRGRGVEILVTDARADKTVSVMAGAVVDPASDDGAVTYEDYAAAAEGDLDPAADGSRRVEQAFLRRVLLAGRQVAPCMFCSRVLPANLLVAAHLKRRSELSRQEKLRFRQVAVLACTLGCDALYEHGYLSVDEHGRLLTAPVDVTALDDHLAVLAGKLCGQVEPASGVYLAEHRLQRFRGQGKLVTTPG